MTPSLNHGSITITLHFKQIRLNESSQLTDLWMSSIIWTRDELLSSSRKLSGQCWRVVESQSKGSTLKLTDTIHEQLTLENLIEATKPRIPEQCVDLHYLLFTPFRYSPYPH